MFLNMLLSGGPNDWKILQIRDKELSFKHNGTLNEIGLGYEALEKLRGNPIRVLAISTLPPEVEVADRELHDQGYHVGYWVPLQGTQEWIAKVFRVWKGRPSTQYALAVIGSPGIQMLRVAKEVRPNSRDVL